MAATGGSCTVISAGQWVTSGFRTALVPKTTTKRTSSNYTTITPRRLHYNYTTIPPQSYKKKNKTVTLIAIRIPSQASRRYLHERIWTPRELYPVSMRRSRSAHGAARRTHGRPEWHNALATSPRRRAGLGGAVRRQSTRKGRVMEKLRTPRRTVRARSAQTEQTPAPAWPRGPVYSELAACSSSSSAASAAPRQR